MPSNRDDAIAALRDMRRSRDRATWLRFRRWQLPAVVLLAAVTIYEVLLTEIWPDSRLNLGGQLALSAMLPIGMALPAVLESGLDRLRCCVTVMILGCFCAATAWITPVSPAHLAPFVSLLGGVCLVLAGLWFGGDFAQSGVLILFIAWQQQPHQGVPVFAWILLPAGLIAWSFVAARRR